jgi:RNA polymerase sigma-70 factor (ECF subfamily)
LLRAIRKANLVKAAINLRRMGAAATRKGVTLTGHLQRKAKRLLKRGPTSTPEPTTRESKPPNLDSSSLSETIRLAQQGDATAFESIYRLHSGRVHALCLRMLRDPVEAEDLTQEVFMQLFRKIHTFRGESAFSTWLHRLTANLVLMRLRKKKPISTSLDKTIGSDKEDDRPRNDIGGPDLSLTGLFDRFNLQTAIDQLPMGYKLAFVLHDVYGYEHNEIAEIRECSEGNSKSQLHKARKRLRDLLRRMQHYKTQQNAETIGPLAPVAKY